MKAVWIHILLIPLPLRAGAHRVLVTQTGGQAERVKGGGEEVCPPQAWRRPLALPHGADPLCSSSVAGQPRLPLQPNLPLQSGLWVTLSPGSSSSSLSWTSQGLPWLRHPEPR